MIMKFYVFITVCELLAAKKPTHFWIEKLVQGLTWHPDGTASVKSGRSFFFFLLFYN